MAITIYLRSTATHVGTLGSHGNFDLETTTGTTSSQSFGANTPRTFVYYSATTFPNLTDWTTGDYTWNVDVTTANANVQLTTVKVSRYDSTLTTEKASGSASPNLTLSTTGLKTGTVSFASPNPAGRAADDRLVLTLTFSKLAGGGLQSINADVNGSGDSRLDTPLIIPVVRDISESSVSISENLDDTETYVKSITESSISASDSIEGTKIPAAPENEVYSVHFVEFPEEVTDSLYVPPPVAVEQVSTTKTHKYDVIGKVTTTKTHKYNVIEQVTSTKTYKYNVLQTITQTKTHKFNLLQQITQTKTHLYNIIQKITRLRTHKYHVEGRVTSTKTHKFDISGAVEQVSTTKTHIFSVLQRITRTRTHLFSLIQQIVRTRTHKFDLAGRITATKTHKFDIITKITKIKTHLYNILIAVSPATTKTHKYSILQLVARTRTHKYNIVGRITTTKTHRYVMGGKVLSNKTHKYDVGLGAVLKELGGSTNAYVRFQDRVQIIDIIADIKNLAISNVEIPVARPPANIAIATVVIAEYSKRLLTAESNHLRHKTISLQILPPIIETIEQKAIAPHIAVEILPLLDKPQLQIQGRLQLANNRDKIYLQSLTQLKQDKKSIIKIASSIMLEQTQPQIKSESNIVIEYTPLNRAHILAPEIMTKQKAKTLKTLINLLSSDHLFE